MKRETISCTYFKPPTVTRRYEMKNLTIRRREQSITSAAIRLVTPGILTSTPAKVDLNVAISQ